MFTRDYVMRQINQLSQVLALVLFQKRSGGSEESREIMARGMLSSLGVELDLILAMDYDTLLALASTGSVFSTDLAVSIADLLMEEDSESGLERAKWLYQVVLEKGGTLPLHVLSLLTDQDAS